MARAAGADDEDKSVSVRPKPGPCANAGSVSTLRNSRSCGGRGEMGTFQMTASSGTSSSKSSYSSSSSLTVFLGRSACRLRTCIDADENRDECPPLEELCPADLGEDGNCRWPTAVIGDSDLSDEMVLPLLGTIICLRDLVSRGEGSGSWNLFRAPLNAGAVLGTFVRSRKDRSLVAAAVFTRYSGCGRIWAVDLSPHTLGDIAADTSSRLISSKQLRSAGATSPGLEDGNDDDLEDLESVRSGGEPGDEERADVDAVQSIESVKGRRCGERERCFGVSVKDGDENGDAMELSLSAYAIDIIIGDDGDAGESITVDFVFCRRFRIAESGRSRREGVSFFVWE
jgi:hypothetical protein